MLPQGRHPVKTVVTLSADFAQTLSVKAQHKRQGHNTRIFDIAFSTARKVQIG